MPCKKHDHPTDNANHATCVIAKVPQGDTGAMPGDYMKWGDFQRVQRHYNGYTVEKWKAGKLLALYEVNNYGILEEIRQ